jgi:hypothetical protein
MPDRTDTLRFPRNLDRDAIVGRLIALRESSQLLDHPQLCALLAGIETLPPPQVGSRVIEAMNWLEGKSGVEAIAKKLSIVAMNLKNLK